MLAECCREGRKVVAPVDADFVGQLHEGFLRGRGEQCKAEEEGLNGDRGKIGDEGDGKGTTPKRRQA